MQFIYKLTGIKNLTRQIIERLFQKAQFYERRLEKKIASGIPIPRDLDGARVYVAFFEESTRTYSTFCAAAAALGAVVTGLPLAQKFSGFAKEEALKHIVEFWSGVRVPYLRLADIIVLRHYEPDAAERAVQFSKVPIINAGTGGEGGDHPTQALQDGFAFRKFLGESDALSIAFMGDVKFSRIVFSELQLLSLLYSNLRVYAIAPEGFGVNDKLKTFLLERQIPFAEVRDSREIINDCQVCYVLRVQKNRLEDLVARGLMAESEAWRLLAKYQETRDNYAVTRELYDISEKNQTIFCHPGPISEAEQEIRPEVEELWRVRFLEQWALGFPIRMAILAEVWQKQREIDRGARS